MKFLIVLALCSTLVLVSCQIIIIPGFGNRFPFGGPSSGHHHRQPFSTTALPNQGHTPLRNSEAPPIQVFQEAPGNQGQTNTHAHRETGMFAQRLPPQNTFATPEQPEVTISGPGPLPSLEQTIALMLQPLADVLQINRR